jgi:hypothetical protein
MVLIPPSQMHQLIVSKSWDSPSHPHVKENEAAYFINKATIPNTLAVYAPVLYCPTHSWVVIATEE